MATQSQRYPLPVDLRARMLDAAEKLLNESSDGDFSIRDVCDAVDVGLPVLYRLFGDKNGLMREVVNHGFDRYLSDKRAATPSADPVADLRAGWDSHVAFALAHPAIYRLMYSPTLAEVPATAEEARRLLREVLKRCAAAGLLLVPLEAATQTVMAANVGVALSMVTQPHAYTDAQLSERIRDATHAAVLALDSSPGDVVDADGRALATSALRLGALIDSGQRTRLTEAESSLLQEWLRRLAEGAT